MFSDQCVSVTDLRRNTKKCLSGLETNEKYIFINNKPIAVIVDIKSFEIIKKNDFFTSLKELDESKITPKIKKLSEKAKKMKSSEFINI